MSRPSPNSPLLLVGDIVRGLDEAEWRAAFEAAGWAGTIAAHVHPGRSSDLPLLGGNHEDLDPAFALGGTALIGPEVVVVGIGRSGPVAQLIGLGGRAAAVVTVDGLGGPFVEPREQIAGTLAMIRAVMADEASHELPGSGEVDRRLQLGLNSHGDQDTAGRIIDAMPVPLLLVETTSSPVTAAVVDQLASRSPVATAAHVGEPSPASAALAVVAWIS